MTPFTPLSEFGFVGDTGSLFAAVGIGVAFGWALERAGMGSARKLAGQFYLTDLTVFKVMFSAIVTAMLGAFWLGRLGVLDLSRVYVPETFLAPQFVGGLVFGAGFVIGGLCPGTACASAATGRIDGLLLAVGMFLGVLGTGLAFTPLQPFYESTARGTFTLPSLLHLPYGVVVAGVVAMALAGFVGAEAIERRTAARGARTPSASMPSASMPSASESTRKHAAHSPVLTPRRLASSAAVLGVLAAFAGSPYTATADRAPPGAPATDVPSLIPLLPRAGSQPAPPPPGGGTATKGKKRSC